MFEPVWLCHNVVISGKSIELVTYPQRPRQMLQPILSFRLMSVRKMRVFVGREKSVGKETV